GGEGAPLAPLYHAALAADLPKPLAVLNLGGVGNVTWIGPGADRSEDQILAFDTGPGNALIDDWVRSHTGEAADLDGALARAGEAVGWNGDALEAQAFAYLAMRSSLGLPLSLPSTTGAPHPVCGGRLFEAVR